MEVELQGLGIGGLNGFVFMLCLRVGLEVGVGVGFVTDFEVFRVGFRGGE